MKTYSVQSLFDWLSAKGQLERRQEAEAFILTRENVKPLSLTMKVFMGFWAFACSMGIIIFLFALYILKYAFMGDIFSFIMLGLIFIVISLLFYYLTRHKQPVLQNFGLQSAFIMMIVGKILLVISVITLSIHREWMAPIGIFVIAFPTYFLFPIQLDRFLSASAFIISIIINAILLYSSNQYFFATFIALGVCAGFIFTWKKKTLHWSPIGYAAVVGLFVCTLYLGSLIKHIIPSSVPGILLCLTLMVLGYAKYDRILYMLGACFLALFLIEFYYFLPYTLEYKAGILVGTGSILIASSMLIKKMHWGGDK